MSWRKVSLGEILPLRYGKGLPARDRSESGEYAVFSSAGLTGSHSAPLTTGPSVVIGRKGTIGAAYFCPKPVWPIDTTFYVEPTASTDIRFAYYLINSLPLKKMNNDSAVPGLNRAHAESLEVLLPPPSEQRAIAATLGALDDKIESNGRAISGIFDLIDAYSDKFGKALPLVPLSALTTSVKRSINPSTLDGAVVDHFSLPAFDSGASPERVSAFTIKSNKLMVPQQAILLSRLKDRKSVV